MTTETIDDITAGTDFSEFPAGQEIDFNERDRTKPVIDVAMMTKSALTWGKAIQASQKFGCANDAQGFLLALECLKKGITPNDWLERYHIVDGKKSMKAEAMRAAFAAAGGKIKWTNVGDEGIEVEATFTAPDGQKLQAKFTMEDAKRLGVSFKTGSNWQKDPGAMMRARLTSKALRIIAPEILGGCYLPEETAEFVGSVEPTPANTSAPQAAAAPVAEKPAATVVATTKPTPIAQQPVAQDPAFKPLTDDELVAAIKDAAKAAKLEPAYVKSRVTGLKAANLASLSRENKEWLLAEFRNRVKTEEARQDFMNKLDNAGITGKGDDNAPPFETTPAPTESAPKN